MRVERVYGRGRVEVRDHRLIGNNVDAGVIDRPHWKSVSGLSPLPQHQTCDGPTAAHHGDPTEVAFVEFAQQYANDDDLMIEHFPRMGELPFDAVRKRMTAIHWVKENWWHS
jgi:hypothetical protein